MWNSICCGESEISERIGRNHVRGDSCSGYLCSPVNLNWMALRPGTSQLEWIVPFMWLGPCDSGFGVLSQKLLLFFCCCCLSLQYYFWPCKYCGKHIYTQIHSTRFHRYFFYYWWNPVLRPLTTWLKRIVFLLKIFQFMAIFSFYY